jgi:DNA-binding transcriptional regulator YhcF (GntR family)
MKSGAKIGDFEWGYGLFGPDLSQVTDPGGMTLDLAAVPKIDARLPVPHNGPLPVRKGQNAMPESEGQYFRVLNLLLAGIDDGTWPPGAAVPSEKDLREMTGASRTTIQLATGRLRHYGFLYGPPGGTTRVAAEQALRHARRAWREAEQARDLNSQT